MSFFDRLFGKKNSAESAKERLQLVCPRPNGSDAEGSSIPLKMI